MDHIFHVAWLSYLVQYGALFSFSIHVDAIGDFLEPNTIMIGRITLLDQLAIGLGRFEDVITILSEVHE